MQGPVAYKTPSSGLAGTGSQMETPRGALHAGESNRAQEYKGLALAMSERQAADVASYRQCRTLCTPVIWDRRFQPGGVRGWPLLQVLLIILYESSSLWS